MSEILIKKRVLLVNCLKLYAFCIYSHNSKPGNLNQALSQFCLPVMLTDLFVLAFHMELVLLLLFVLYLQEELVFVIGNLELFKIFGNKMAAAFKSALLRFWVCDFASFFRETTDALVSITLFLCSICKK